MSRNPLNRLTDNLIPGASTSALQQWMREELADYERLKGKSALKSFRSATRRRMEAIRQELASRGEEIPRDPEPATASPLND